ncbi:MAG: universal stress protein [Chitinophagaceae bacterium]
MKRIIAPVDFSEAAENAAQYAGNLAAFYGAELWLYHTYEVIIPVSDVGYPFVNLNEMQQAAEYELAAFKERIQSKIKPLVTIKYKAENTTLSEGLTAFCEELKPDMVVMGLSGKNALTRFVVGSNTIRTVQQLAYPVLVVPPKADFIPIRKIGFACDYSKLIATSPIEPLKTVVTDFRAELFVLNIIYNSTSLSPEGKEEAIYITELLKDLKPTYQTILSDDVTNGINWFAEKEKIDWVVVIPQKHKLMDKIFKRSQTKDLIYHTHLPVLCMHE